MRIRRIAALTITASILIAAVPANASTLTKSRFTSGDEDWSAFWLPAQNTQFSWDENAGSGIPTNPDAGDGCIKVSFTNPQPAATLDVTWVAPAKFLGDKSAAYKGSFTFDQQWRRSPGTNAGTLSVSLVGKDGTKLRYEDPSDVHGFDTGTFVWDSYVIPLTKTGWLDVTTGSVPATGTEMKDVLRHLKQLTITTHDPAEPTTTTFLLDGVKLKTP
jgi:hypothetical protein